MSVFQPGEPCLLVDGKGRHYLVKLDPERQFQYHRGVVDHSAIIGRDDGTWVEASSGDRLLALRPRLADYILRMRRGAQVVYPKDIGPILVYADIGPGKTVLEAGTGSGALTMALVRAVGEKGRVVSVERREDHARQGRRNIERYFGEIPPQLELRIGDVEPVVAEIAPERLILDLPEPWHAVEPAAEHQPPGGIFCGYLPTVPQVQTLVDALRATRAYAEIEVKEFLFRDWNVSGRSVRPEHTMVGHTGFLVFARRTERREARPSDPGPDTPDETEDSVD
ncbi:MAG: tRNA (adenine-N1)-methyltransferase [Actinomycetes bacterium]